MTKLAISILLLTDRLCVKHSDAEFIFAVDTVLARGERRIGIELAKDILVER